MLDQMFGGGLSKMGDDLEAFTNQTGRALAEIATELRIGNALMAIHMANAQDTPGFHGPATPLEIMAEATQLAANLATAERDAS